MIINYNPLTRILKIRTKVYVLYFSGLFASLACNISVLLTEREGRRYIGYISIQESSSGVVVRSTGAYKRVSGHPAGLVLGMVVRVEYTVPKHYTCQAVRSGFRESFSWLSIVVRMKRKIEVPPT